MDVPPLAELENAGPPPQRTPWGSPILVSLVGQKGARLCFFVSAVDGQSSRDAICPQPAAIPPPSSGQVLAEPSALTWAAGLCDPTAWRWLAAYPRVARNYRLSTNNASSSRYRWQAGRVGVSHGCINGPRLQDSWVTSAQAMFRRSGSLMDRISLLVLVSGPTATRYEEGGGEHGNGGR